MKLKYQYVVSYDCLGGLGSDGNPVNKASFSSKVNSKEPLTDQELISLLGLQRSDVLHIEKR